MLAVMTPSKKVVNAEERAMSKLAVLVVMSPAKRQSPLLSELDLMQAAVKVSENFREARKQLESDPNIDVVITDLTLADGNWSDLLRFLVNRGLRAGVVVNTGCANEACWSEVLWRGGYDLLIEPYERSEVRRVVEGAVRASRASRLSTGPNTATRAQSA